MSNKRKTKINRHRSMGVTIDPRMLEAFSIKTVPVEEVVPTQLQLSPEEKSLTRLYKVFATTVWRMHNLIIDTETKEPRETLDERAVSRLTKYLSTLNGALEDANVQIKGDYVGHRYDEGDAVKVIAFEPRKDLAHDEYIETLLPTVRWIDKDGNHKLLQQAEVVVGQATSVENA